jgi:hypothetical protein
MDGSDMNQQGHEKNPDTEKGEPTVRCRRTGETYSAAEHERCPYCFGKKAGVVAGEYEQFCDYDETKDPIHFGFPPDSQRHRDG